MLQLKRQDDILRLLKKEKEMTVKELCAALYCSPATVRRDLTELERRGLLKRSFGGAVLNENFFDQQPLSIRGVKNIAEKQRICAKAAQLLHAAETVFIDASSTTYFLAPYLKDIPNLTVITNNPHLNIVLSEMKVHNYCTGGEMLNSSIALVGSEAERFVRGIRADAFFFSARGVYGGEIYDTSKAERDMKRVMLEHSGRHYFLCDSSKRGDQAYPYRIAALEEMDAVIDEGKG
ncbi:MAG: DeoR/GlpR transcriptional regulator [Clostridia bacterium]|nr:DeoR/GlpR transcriptional regulator [Clostridia bacterium]